MNSRIFAFFVVVVFVTSKNHIHPQSRRAKAQPKQCSSAKCMHVFLTTTGPKVT